MRRGLGTLARLSQIAALLSVALVPAGLRVHAGARRNRTADLSMPFKRARS
jgi:hypothetical protein